MSCPNCLGSGQRQSRNSMLRERCMACQGNGSLAPGVSACRTCSGYGTRFRRSGSGYERCMVCLGEGKLDSGARPCPTCSGYGSHLMARSSTSYQFCNACQGKGRIVTAPAAPNVSSGAVNIITGYHQTSPAAGQAILATGFQRGSSGIAGGGIYFAMNPQDTNQKAHNKGFMLKASVDVGRAKIMTHFDPAMTLRKLNAEGFDSVFLPAGDGVVSKNEYVVYEPHRIKSVVQD